jgi:hypothetical protein
MGAAPGLIDRFGGGTRPTAHHKTYKRSGRRLRGISGLEIEISGDQHQVNFSTFPKIRLTLLSPT